MKNDPTPITKSDANQGVHSMRLLVADIARAWGHRDRDPLVASATRTSRARCIPRAHN
jgi:hypothetical protein